MIAGRLNEVIKIFSPITTRNEYNEQLTEMQETYTTRAKVDNTSGNRANENNEIVFNYSFQFNVRLYVPVTEHDEIEWQGKRYRILTIVERREYNDKVIQAELINN